MLTSTAMRGVRHAFRWSFVGLLAAFLAGPLSAQSQRNPLRPLAQNADPAKSDPKANPNANPKADPAEANPLVRDELPTAAVLESRIKKLEDNTVIEEELKKKIAEPYREALKALTDAEKSAARAATLVESTKSAPEQIAALRARGKASPQVIASVSTLPDAEKALADAEQQLEAARAEMSKLKNEPDARDARRAVIAGNLQPAARARLTAATEELESQPPPGEPALLTAALRLAAAARKKAAEEKLNQYQREIENYTATDELVTLNRDLAAVKVSQAEALVTAYTEKRNELRMSAAERTVERARRMSQLVESSPEPIPSLAQQNIELAERNVGEKGLPASIADATRELDAVHKLSSSIEKRSKRVMEKAKLAGMDNVIGFLLRTEREALPDTSAIRERIAARQKRTVEAERIRLDLDEQRSLLADIDRRVEQELNQATVGLPAERRGELESQLRGVLEAQRELLDELLEEYKDYLGKLVELNVTEQQLVVQTEAYSAFIAERILWIRSAEPIDLDTFRRSGEAVAWLFGPQNWGPFGGALIDDILAKPVVNGAFLIALLSILVFHQNLRRRLRELGDQAASTSASSITPSLWAVLLTMLMAAVWPGLLWFVAWRLNSGSYAQSEFIKAVIGGLNHTAIIYLTAELFRQICRGKGLAESHFGWDPDSMKKVRRGLEWLMMLGLPIVFVVASIQWQSNAARQDSFGRLSFIVGMIAIAVFARQMLRPKTGVIFALLEARHSGGWSDKLRYLWYPLGAGIPLFLAGIAVFGYYYTALSLASRMVDTVWLALGMFTIHAMLLRWLLITRRKMALDNARKRRNAAISASKSSESELPAPRPEESEVDLTTVSAQAQRLLRTVVHLAAVLGIWAIWVDVLPALGVFRQIVLWAEGAKQITLADLGLASVIALLAMAGARNIPGLLEIVILQRLPIDAGGRYAVTAISRYVITILGLTMAFGAIGIGWEQVQWLAAAVTVGLGFGLQEIFANFVSGIIILFERPVRVGDTITVGGTTGSVARIRIRATTIVDGDRKELIIPNKEFVTGAVVNWTLTDTITRMVIRLGIAYGSDTEQATDLLLKVAQQHPLVLRDPAPRAIFRNFGDSSLDLELRVFIPSLDSFLKVQHELHTAIDQAFKAQSIEIPFPQRDVHVRTLPKRPKLDGSGADDDYDDRAAA